MKEYMVILTNLDKMYFFECPSREFLPNFIKYIVLVANFSNDLENKNSEANFGQKTKNIKNIMKFPTPTKKWGSTNFY